MNFLQEFRQCTTIEHLYEFRQKCLEWCFREDCNWSENQQAMNMEEARFYASRAESAISYHETKGEFLPQIETPKPESAPVPAPRYLVVFPHAAAPPFYTNYPGGVNATVVDFETQKYSLPDSGNQWHDVDFDTL